MMRNACRHLLATGFAALCSTAAIAQHKVEMLRLGIWISGLIEKLRNPV